MSFQVARTHSICASRIASNLVFKPTQPSLHFIRLNSTAKQAATSAAAAAAKSEGAVIGETLTWPQYLAIRKSKRHYQTIATIPSAFLAFAGGLAYFGSLETDPFKPIMGIDPFFFYGICTVGCLGTGAIIGPSIGTYFWRLANRRVIQQVDAKDREFFHRIAKRRIDASLQNPTSPIPDYYGERIGSLAEYRQWLRDQAKYRRKAILPEEL